jgi:hypothetical protein
METMLLLFAAAVTQLVKADQTPLRSGCGGSDAVVAVLKAGTPVRVGFSLAGSASPCFQVTASVEGKDVGGYLPGSSLSGAEDFERARREAPAVMGDGGISSPGPKAATTAIPSGLLVPHPDLQRAYDLIQRNHPAEAQEILEKLMKQNPREPLLLGMAGMAAYRADRVPQAVEYLKASIELAPNPIFEKLLKDIQRESSIDKSSERKYGIRFLLRYDGTAANPELAAVILETLEQEFSRVSYSLGCRADERIVTIVQTRDAFMNITRASQWTGALYDGKIRIPILDSKQMTAEARKTFAHEIVHACLANMGRWPNWLHEGLAMRMAGETPPAEARKTILQMGKEGKLPKLGVSSGSWQSMSAQQAALAYTLSWVAVDKLMEINGEAGLRNLLNNPETLPRVAADLDRRLRGEP